MTYEHNYQGFIKEKEGYIFENSSSILIPKENTEHSYIILENNKIILKKLMEKFYKNTNIKKQ